MAAEEQRTIVATDIADTASLVLFAPRAVPRVGARSGLSVALR